MREIIGASEFFSDEMLSSNNDNETCLSSEYLVLENTFHISLIVIRRMLQRAFSASKHASDFTWDCQG